MPKTNSRLYNRTSANQGSRAKRGVLIFLVEDDTLIIEVYKTALENAGFKVEAFTLGQDMVKCIEKIEAGDAKTPSLILLDIILPDIDGTQVLEKIRQSAKTKEVPVFVFTNYINPELKKKCENLSIEKYIIKTNCPPSELVKLVKEKLG
ncbi:response regulator [Patescibacteria group bacterium]|nr:response regulator [Patescibacteria group bacterium]MBU4368004.1 response regulator [Patescibacteria group bacterium]MBU4462239.1 response regulator [Patescibacteria group bacterium]MCG2699595.1 response regulator [Candidatus Parcubacteria bacterium]